MDSGAPDRECRATRLSDIAATSDPCLPGTNGCAAIQDKVDGLQAGNVVANLSNALVAVNAEQRKVRLSDESK